MNCSKLRTSVLAVALAAFCASNPGWAQSLVRSSTPLPSSSPEAEGFDPARLDRLPELLRAEIEQGHHAGAIWLVARHGHVVASGACGVRDVSTGAPMEPDTICRIYSMSKVIAAVSALQLVERGLVRIDDPVGRWLPELSDLQVCTGGTVDALQLEPVRNPITLRMLLNHTAGFSYDFIDSPVGELYRRADLWSATSLEVFLERVARLPLVAQPGTAWNYSISDDVLGAVVERISGVEFGEYVARNVTGPLGMVDTDFDVAEASRDRLAALHQSGADGLQVTPPRFGSFAEPGRGFASGGAGMFSTVGDYARFAQMLIAGGELDGVRILGRKTLELARRSSLPDGVRTAMPGDTWGLFSAMRTDLAAAGEPSSDGMLYWNGAATTAFLADPAEELVAVMFCQHFPYDEHHLIPRFRALVYQALR